jgi:hypothetical protein
MWNIRLPFAAGQRGRIHRHRQEWLQLFGPRRQLPALAIERMRGWKDACRNRLLTDLSHQ